MIGQTLYREIPAAHLRGFVARGYRGRQCFAHKTFTIPKCGPDAVQLATNMVGENRADAFWLLTLHATGEVLGRFPDELFFDDDLIWHRLQYGQPGHIAFAMFVTVGKTIYGLNYVSDIVQRQSHAQPHRTQIQARFNGWNHMVLNALMGFALDNGIETILSPTADLVMRNTDLNRTVEPAMFERIYDASITDFYAAQRIDHWWHIDVRENRGRAVIAERHIEDRPTEKTICVTHDIERGLGHVETDMDFARGIDDASRRYLDKMLTDERRAGVRATYNVVGSIYDDVKDKITTDGHCLAFHSYDHLQGGGDANQIDDQLSRCRSVDYRTRGYRVPKSRLTAELTPQRLLRLNFDWLASSASSIDATMPELRDNIVYTPIMFDDFALHTGDMNYQTWEDWALNCVRQREFVAFGLHDCYGAHWTEQYPEFLEKISSYGNFRTCDQVADDVVLAHCV